MQSALHEITAHMLPVRERHRRPCSHHHSSPHGTHVARDRGSGTPPSGISDRAGGGGIYAA